MTDYLTEEHLKLLLGKEWLVKIDGINSVPYLMKYYAPESAEYCCIMITNTKQVWGEVLTAKHFDRRWRSCNLEGSSCQSLSAEDEKAWRNELSNVLAMLHTLGGIADASFDVVESSNADFAFELRRQEFKWKWETYSLGPKVSAEVLSKHLIMPLISVTHLAFGSADPVSDLSAADLEKAVDKAARTGRRVPDTHVKHALSRPRVATSLQRMTAMFNFQTDLPPIISEAAEVEIRPPTPPRSRAPSEVPHHSTEPTPRVSASFSGPKPSH